MTPTQGSRMMKAHQRPLAPPDSASSRKTSLMMEISNQNHATNSMNQKIETIASHKLIAASLPCGGPGHARQDESAAERASPPRPNRMILPPPAPHPSRRRLRHPDAGSLAASRRRSPGPRVR